MKKFNNNIAVRITAFILCAALFITTIIGMAFMGRSTFLVGNSVADVEDILLSDNYKESMSFQNDFNEKLNKILNLIHHYKSEEYIKSGKTIGKNELEQATRSLFYEGQYDYELNYDDDYYDIDTIYIEGNDYHDNYSRDYDDPSIANAFKEEHSEEINKIKEVIIKKDLQSFKRLKNDLNYLNGFTYYVSDGTYNISNVSNDFDANVFNGKEGYLSYVNGEFKKTPKVNNKLGISSDIQLKNILDSELNDKLIVYLSYDDKFIAEKQIQFDNAKHEITKVIPIIAICSILTLLLFIYLIAITGRKDETGKRSLYKIDGLFTEIQIVIIGISLGFGGDAFLNYVYDTFYNDDYYPFNSITWHDGIMFPTILAGIMGFVISLVGLWFILSCVRTIKAGNFLKNSIIYKCVKGIWRGIKEIYNGGSLMRKVVIITLALCILSATVFFAPLMIVLVLIFAPKWVKKYEEIKKGVDEVKNGNLTYKIPIDGNDELSELAKGINEISAASNLAIQNELKNQRLKTDLISNVSHDLKTPLTSIITYVDLLKKEGLTCEDAPKYLDILDQKSQRLKKLTEDLFDAAKASSGAIPVNFEKIEILSLINQGLGEMSDKIQASNLEIKVNSEKEKYYVRADGQLLWRVLENLLGNVLKYAQEGSRVYIDIKDKKTVAQNSLMVVMEIKNISKNELNIGADELMERFKRGDESRTTEGSGLGLAIAKDLVKLQNGWFEIKIDGDLFKTITMLEGYPQENIKED